MTHLYPIGYLDPPEILDMSVTNIPGSGSLPLQVVSDLGFKAGYAIQFQDTSGDQIGVYIGTSGNEVIRTIIGNGTSEIFPVVIPAHSRVSLRSMKSVAITNGQLTMIFLGAGLP